MTDKLQQLVDTLTKSGLAASTTEARRMAQNILGTETKVSKDFDRKNQQIDRDLSNKSYKDEINDIIKKTSFENKKFHIPVKGYTQEDRPRPSVQAQSPVPPPADVQARPQMPISQPVERAETRPTPDGEIDIPTPERLQKVKPVFTDAVDDERTLMEIMNQDAKEVYQNKGSTEAPEKEEVVQYNIRPSVVQETPQSAPQETPQQNPAPEKPEHQAESAPVQDTKTEAKKEFKNPIDDVDLMDYFTFG